MKLQDCEIKREMNKRRDERKQKCCGGSCGDPQFGSCMNCRNCEHWNVDLNISLFQDEDLAECKKCLELTGGDEHCGDWKGPCNRGEYLVPREGQNVLDAWREKYNKKGQAG